MKEHDIDEAILMREERQAAEREAKAEEKAERLRCAVIDYIKEHAGEILTEVISNVAQGEEAWLTEIATDIGESLAQPYYTDTVRFLERRIGALLTQKVTDYAEGRVKEISNWERT